jgi:acetyl-CoA carboxylase biotin carboxyl carrier protein
MVAGIVRPRYRSSMAQVEVLAEMAANVWQVHVELGQVVAEGDIVVILESMKMEIPVEAPSAGTVTALNVAPESQVQDGDVIAIITT